MDVAEILARAASYVGQNVTIPETEGLRWVNACLDDIGPDGGAEATCELGVSANIWAPLPADFVYLLEIRENGLPYEGAYDIRNGQMRFPRDGTYILDYAAIPAPVTLTTDVPNVNYALHPAIAMYVAYRYVTWKKDNDPRGQRLYAEYLALKQRALGAVELQSAHGSRTIEMVSWGEDEVSFFPF